MLYCILFHILHIIYRSIALVTNENCVFMVVKIYIFLTAQFGAHMLPWSAPRAYLLCIYDKKPKSVCVYNRNKCLVYYILYFTAEQPYSTFLSGVAGMHAHATHNICVPCFNVRNFLVPPPPPGSRVLNLMVPGVLGSATWQKYMRVLLPSHIYKLLYLVQFRVRIKRSGCSQQHPDWCARIYVIKKDLILIHENMQPLKIS